MSKPLRRRTGLSSQEAEFQLTTLPPLVPLIGQRGNRGQPRFPLRRAVPIPISSLILRFILYRMAVSGYEEGYARGAKRPSIRYFGRFGKPNVAPGLFRLQSAKLFPELPQFGFGGQAGCALGSSASFGSVALNAQLRRCRQILLSSRIVEA